MPVGLLLALCNFFPAPPPLIKAKNHSEHLISAAIDYLHQNALPGSVIFADYESGLLLGYYGCGHGIVQYLPASRPLCPPRLRILTEPFRRDLRNGDSQRTIWRGELKSAAASTQLPAGTKVWLFDAGWINDLAPAISRSADCAEPRFFGENI